MAKVLPSSLATSKDRAGVRTWRWWPWLWLVDSLSSVQGLGEISTRSPWFLYSESCAKDCFGIPSRSEVAGSRGLASCDPEPWKCLSSPPTTEVAPETWRGSCSLRVTNRKSLWSKRWTLIVGASWPVIGHHRTLSGIRRCRARGKHRLAARATSPEAHLPATCLQVPKSLNVDGGWQPVATVVLGKAAHW